MRKITLLLMALALVFTASAEPANPTPVILNQPNGETIKIKLVGDEFYNFNTTIDDYTVINNNGTWEYASPLGDKLVPSGIMAHDPQMRNAKEIQFVATLNKRLVDSEKRSSGLKARARRDLKNRVGHKEAIIDYSKFRGLIVLINYADRTFGMNNPNNFYDNLCNTKDYTGFYHQNRFQYCTGSVRDYYYDNSMGQFDPEFDIVGPVTVSWNATEGNDNSREIFQNALDQIDNQVDFTQYDADNDGMIDMVFFMVAGYSSSYSGNNSGYLWPHMSYLYGYDGTNYYYLEYDGKYMGRYASSCEIYGWESYGYTVPNAIGTICHEFGHVLGLPDFYDTDYNGSGGQSNDPGGWDVMAGGSHNDYGRTPVGYSLWERWELGFADKPQELSRGSKTIYPVDASNTGYMMSSPNENEYFLFENRQANKWDAALPGHGLVITRVDRSNQEIWESNKVNCNPSRNYYELIRASGTDDSQVPFPGSYNVNEINSTTEPAILTWDGTPCAFGLSNIAENNGNITFNVVNDVIPHTLIEDFEATPITTATNPTDVLGNFATWSLPKASVEENSAAIGSKAALLQAPGGLTMTSDINVKTIKLSLTAINQSTTLSKVQLQYSFDEGATWNTVSTENATASSTTNLEWRLNDINQPVRFKIMQTSGAKNKKLLIDNITITYTDSTFYDLMIAGTQVNGANMGNLSQIEGVDGILQYLPISGTLRMKNATINSTTSGMPAIRNTLSQNGLTIDVQGENNIGAQGACILLSSNYKSTISGTGSININGAIAGINISKTGLMINGGVKLNVNSTKYGIVGNNSSGTLEIGGDETIVKIKGTSSSLSNIISFILNDGLTITTPEGAYYDSSAKNILDKNGNVIAGEWVTISKATTIAGDVNCDGSVNASDVTALYNYILNGNTTFINTSDVNGDGSVNASDVTAVYNIILGL